MNKTSNNIINFTRSLIDRFGPRPPGSSESRACADALADEAGLFADSVKTEDFTLSPGAFLGWIRILVLSYVFALAGLWLGWYTASAVVLIAAVLLLVFQFFMYKEVLDPFFPKATGRNVIASLEPEGEVRGELIVSGHHDSARIFNFLVYQPKLYGLRVTGSILSLFALTAASIILTVLSYTGVSLSWVKIPAIVFTVLLVLVLQLWFFASKNHTPGAGDNLVSSAAAWAFLQKSAEAKRAGRGFKHLRITAASWDAEEAGLRGARAWRKNQGAVPSSLPRWNLNIECLYSKDEMFLMSSDINGSVKLSDELAGQCARILSDINGTEISVKPIAFLTGGTDAGELARAGVNATTLMGMLWENDSHDAVYHTPEDTVEHVCPEAVDAAIELTERLAEELDEGFLKPE